MHDLSVFAHSAAAAMLGNSSPVSMQTTAFAGFLAFWNAHPCPPAFSARPARQSAISVAVHSSPAHSAASPNVENVFCASAHVIGTLQLSGGVAARTQWNPPAVSAFPLSAELMAAGGHAAHSAAAFELGNSPPVSMQRTGFAAVIFFVFEPVRAKVHACFPSIPACPTR